ARDDFAFAAIAGGGIEQVAAAPPHQEFRTPSMDRIAPSPARRRIAPVVGELRKREDLAPALPRGGKFGGIFSDEKRNGERWIAVEQDERSPFRGIAHGNADEFA